MVVLAAILILPVVANAGVINVTVRTTVGNQSLDQTFTGTTVVAPDGGLECDLVSQDVATLDGGAITSLKFLTNLDPEVGIQFGVRAGNSDTTYDILSDVVLFDPLVNPLAYASAGVTLTDRSPVPGAKITGLFADGKTHQARYNGFSVYANLVDGFAIPSGTVTNSEEKGNEYSMITINGTLTSIESEFNFTLSAKDAASGTSNFSVVPEPATICLLGFGVFGLLRKRKD